MTNQPSFCVSTIDTQKEVYTKTITNEILLNHIITSVHPETSS